MMANAPSIGEVRVSDRPTPTVEGKADLHPLAAVWTKREHTSPAERRLIFVQNALLKAAAARGYKVGSKDASSPECLWVEITGERIEWRMCERYWTRNVPLTKKELKKATDGKTTRREWIASGDLVLT